VEQQLAADDVRAHQHDAGDQPAPLRRGYTYFSETAAFAIASTPQRVPCDP
jgi:hypothetical protein